MNNRNEIVVYGIANCDTVKKARDWFVARGEPVQWHDFKKQGVSGPMIDAWTQVLGWEGLLNRRGTTWRKLSPEVQSGVVDIHSAKALMLSQPSVIRRPIVEWGAGAVTSGFDEGLFTQKLGA